MNIPYKKPLTALTMLALFAGAAFGQKTKVKTITIVNGDTTVNESMTDDDIAKMEKEMNIVISDDGKAGKTVTKKIIIKGDGDDAGATAYAYGMSDDRDQDVEVTTGENGDTKIVIRKSRDGKDDDKQDAKTEKKTIVKRSSVTTMNSSSGKMEKEKLNVSIQVEKMMAKIEVTSGSKAPMNVSILDENGKQVFYDSQQEGENYKKDIPLEKKGTYFLNLIQDKKSTTEKIVVE